MLTVLLLWCRTPRNRGGLGYMQIPIVADTTKVGPAGVQLLLSSVTQTCCQLQAGTLSFCATEKYEHASNLYQHNSHPFHSILWV